MALKAFLDSLDGVDAAVQALYIKGEDGRFKLDAEGIEDVTGLKGALAAQKTAAKKAADDLKALQAQFGDLDPEQVKAIMSRVGNDEETRMIAEGKLDQVIERRTEKLRKDLEKQTADYKTAADHSAQRAKKYEQRVLDDHIRAAAMKAGVHPQAVDDALFRGRAMFSLTEDGDAVQLGEDGQPVPGKDGKTPFGPEEWLSSMKETAPHWFPASSQGGGANGSRGGARTNDLSHLPPAQRISEARRLGKT